MPSGSKNGATPSNGTGDKPVIFQKYFKNGNRTYASQVKISQIGKKYLVLTEGVRDPKTQELKKHTICVFEQDLKQFFAILQETVLYLRSAKDSDSSVAGAVAQKPVPSNGATKPAKPPIATKPPANGNGAKVAVSPAPLKPAMPIKATAPAKPAARPVAVRPQPTAAPVKVAPKSSYRPGTRSNGR